MIAFTLVFAWIIQEDPAFQIDYTETVTMVRLPLLVQKNGKPVQGIQRQQVELQENGMTLEIEAIEDVTLASTCHLLFDVSVSQSDYLRRARRLARDLIRELRAQDRAKVSYFSGRYYALTTYTSRADLLEEALDGLRVRGSTALYDGIVASLRELSAERGPRVLVVFSDGIDVMSRHRDKELSAVVKSYGIPIILVRFERHKLIGAELKQQAQAFETIVSNSGGEIVYDQFGVLRHLTREIRNYGVRTQISFMPPNPEDRERWRSLRIEIPECDACTLEYRRGYQLGN